MTINTIVCFFVLVQAETAPDVKVLIIRHFLFINGVDQSFPNFRGVRPPPKNIIIYFLQLYCIKVCNRRRDAPNVPKVKVNVQSKKPLSVFGRISEKTE